MLVSEAINTVVSVSTLTTVLMAQWKRTINTMSERKGKSIQCLKEKDKQYNVRKKRTINTMSERKGQSIQCLKEKDNQYNV